MKWLLVLSVLLSLVGCDHYYGQHYTSSAPVDPNSTERGQLELERKNLDAINQQLDTEWTTYIKEDVDFAISLDNQQLEAYSQMKEALRTPSIDTATNIINIRKFSALLPEEKCEEFRRLLKKSVELQQRSEEFARKIDAFNQRVDAYNSKEEAARQALINFFALRQKHALIQEQQLQQQQDQRQREQDRIWLHNELQNLQPNTYWQEQLAREQWNEKWKERFKIRPTPLIPAPIIYPK